MKQSKTFLTYILLIVGVCPASAEIRVLAERGEIAPREELVAHAWPAEALQLMAHPSREVIWKNTDEGKFGDRTMIGFRPKHLKDVDEILAIFASTERDYHRIIVKPEKEPARVMERYPKSFRACSLLLIVRSPKMLETWYQNLPINADGRRYSPLQVFTEPPQAGSQQSLIMYAGHESIPLDAVHWPEWTVVIAGTSKEARKDAPLTILINDLAAKYSLPNCMERRARRALENR